MIRGNWNLVKSQKRLIESFLSLSTLNALNLLFPLITLPYIIKAVGPDKYGIYSFALAVIQYCLLLISYGFNYSATKLISQNRANAKKVSEIFSSVLTTKCLISIVLILILFVIALLNSVHNERILMIFWGIGIIIGDVFTPVWLYQGLEKMKYLTIFNVISKLIFTCLIFLIIKSPNDYKYIMLLNSLGYLFAGFFSLYHVLFLLQINYTIPKRIDVLNQLKDSSTVFFSTISMNLYRNSNIILLGIFQSDIIVGYYSAAEKIIKAIQSVLSPVAEALYPHIGYKLTLCTKKDGVKLLSKIIFYILPVLLFVTFLFVIFSNNIVTILLGTSFQESLLLVKIMSPVIILGSLNYLLGIVGLVNLNEDKAFLRYTIVTGAISVLTFLLLIQSFGAFSAAISMVLAELCLFVLCFLKIKKINK